VGNGKKLKRLIDDNHFEVNGQKKEEQLVKMQIWKYEVEVRKI